MSSTYDASIDATIADIQAYWTATMPDVYGQQYDAIPADRVFPYSQSNPPPNCDDGGQTQAPYEEVAGNAFYCSNGDFVAYDEQGLLPKLRENFGEFAVGLVFAHELGHAVQARVGYEPSATVYMEQQADCFAGAWAQHVADSDDANVHLSSSDLDTALAGLLTLSDPSGIDGGQDGAHGNGFDRVSAFQDGYEGGAQACADYQNNPPAVTETGYSSYDDQASGGNLPLERHGADGHEEPRSSTGRRSRRSVTAPDGGRATRRATVTPTAACSTTPSPTARRPTPSATTRRPCSRRTTPSATSPAACCWRARGRRRCSTRSASSSAPSAARKGAECLAGAWAADTASSLSPGDLDEAVTVLVAGNHESTDRGTAFERVAAFRAGYKHGPSKCVQSS